VINSENHIERIEPVTKAKIISRAKLILQSKIIGFTRKNAIALLKMIAQIRAK